MTCEYAEFMETLLSNESKEEDKLIASYEKQIKKINYKFCLSNIDRIYKYMKEARELVNPDEYSDEEELEEMIDFWRYTPKNIFCCIDYQQCESQHLINKSI